MEKIKVWLRNARSIHHRLMANFLRRRGWVAFYLEEECRACNGGVCWLQLYQGCSRLEYKRLNLVSSRSSANCRHAITRQLNRNC